MSIALAPVIFFWETQDKLTRCKINTLSWYLILHTILSWCKGKTTHTFLDKPFQPSYIVFIIILKGIENQSGLIIGNRPKAQMVHNKCTVTLPSYQHFQCEISTEHINLNIENSRS